MAGQDEHLQLAFDGPVATIAFDRAQARNALTTDMLHRLAAALSQCSDHRLPIERKAEA